MGFEILPVSFAGTGYSTPTTVAANNKTDKLFDFKVNNKDTFVSENDNDDVVIRKQSANSDGYVTEKFRGGKLIAKYVENSKWQGCIEYDNDGKLRVLDYHEPNKEYKYKANSVRLEFETGKYTLTHRDDQKRERVIERIEENKLDLKKLGLDSYIDIITEAK